MSSNRQDFRKRESPEMFDRIAPTYDLVNRLLSFGLDTAWRKKVGYLLPKADDLKLLDLATGTADLIIGLCETCPQISSAVGIDLSKNMLEVGQKKVDNRGLQSKIRLEAGDAMSLEWDDNLFEAVTMSFGIRNVPDAEKTLKEVYRVLKPAGKALILEFSIPSNIFIRWGHLFYLRHVLPMVGALFSGDYQAYRYLNTTIEHFPYGDDFTKLMTEAGFSFVNIHPLTFGVATLYEGIR